MISRHSSGARPLRGVRPQRGSGPMRALAGRWSRPVGAVAASGALLATGVTAAHGDPGAAPSAWAHEFLVDSLGTEGDDARGDGVCATASGACTLRAAIEESNTINAGVGQVRIGVHPDFAGGLIDITGPSESTWMRTTPVSTGGTITGDNGAVFEITAPVTIDLENRLRAAPPNSSAVPSAAVFHIDGPDITLQGVDDSWGAETTFYVGPRASDVHITGGTMATPNANPKRFLVVRGGASNVRLTDYEVSGFASNGTTQGWGFVDGSSASAPVSGLAVEGVRYSGSATGACNASSATGCTSSPMSLRNQTVRDLTFSGNTVVNFAQAVNSSSRLVDLRSAVVDTMTFERNVVEGARLREPVPLIDFGRTTAEAARVEEFSIADNTFTGLQVTHASPSAVTALVHLPQGRGIGRSGSIVDNRLHATPHVSVSAVHWTGPHGSSRNVTPSGVTIERNDMVGFQVWWGTTSLPRNNLVHLSGTGAVTVRMNTHRSPALSTAWAPNDFEIGLTENILVNANEGANGKLAPWFPTARGNAATQPTPYPVGCTAEFDIEPRTERRLDAPTVVDVLWGTATGHSTAVLDSIELTSQQRQRIAVTIPAAGDPRLAHLEPDAVAPIDPATGAISGHLRVQAHYAVPGGQLASTQISRALTITGSCRVDLSIDQAADQNDPTLARDLHYTVKSTLPLDPGTFTPDSLTVTAEPTDDTIDAERLNPRAVSVTPVAGTGNTEFTVVAQVDDSAVVTAAIEPGRVTAEAGVTNIGAATSSDNQITFVNPVVVDPPAVALVVGSGEEAEYALGVRPGAPVPSDDLRFSTALDARGTELGVTLGTPDPEIRAGSGTTGPLPVTVGSPDLDENGLSVSVGHAVTSADRNYDGLVVGALDVRLFSTNPNLEITKQAFVDVGDPTSPASVLATGTEAPAGSRLSDGQAVCWVYTVTNTSADDWASVLTDVSVRDTDTRLGSDGLIGTLPELGVGAVHRLHACAVLIPSDTRVPG
ncbi:hypothetical protein [Cellulomonas sp. Y8]|uniref:hypothetical protein n=1 Tax=Cellulomonas sp. Y8 TaxID=2591145 RepID=UPI0011CB54F7|nr:hypothetical protein [Cellulomonas sp. Y8]